MSDTGSTALGSIVATVIALAFVLVLAWGALRLLKLWQDRSIGGGAQPGTDRALRFLRALPVGTRERVMLIEAEGERMLIGVTAGGITLLARWPGTATKPGDDALPPP